MIPMMLGSTLGSLMSGQLLSRAGGHYKRLGLIAATVMCAGIFLFSRVTATTSEATIIVDSLIFGLGVGVTMPLYIIAVQNTVSNNMLGVATTSVSFFRMIGSSIGLAILGSVMNNHFTKEFLGKIPESVKSVIPADTLSSLANNPRALINPEAQAQLQQQLGHLGSQGPALFEQVLKALREALASSIAEVFLFALIPTLCGFLLHFWLKEIPLKKYHASSDKPPAAPKT